MYQGPPQNSLTLFQIQIKNQNVPVPKFVHIGSRRKFLIRKIALQLKETSIFQLHLRDLFFGPAFVHDKSHANRFEVQFSNVVVKLFA